MGKGQVAGNGSWLRKQMDKLSDKVTQNETDINALETATAGKANATHGHAISDVTNLQSTIDGLNSNISKKQDSSTAITTSNIESQRVNYANVSGTASTLGRGGDTRYPMAFYWSGKGGQPQWLWGGDDATNMYVYNPANFNVNYANSAGYIGGEGNNRIAVRAYTGTPSVSGQIFLQEDFTNNCINVGIDGLGAIGVNSAKNANYASSANSATTSSYLNTISVTSANLDKITTSGVYKTEDHAGLHLHMNYDKNYAIQISHFVRDGQVLKCRIKTSGTWSAYINL